MRTIILIFNLWLILLSGGSNAYAETHPHETSSISTQHFTESKLSGFSNKEQNTTFIEDTDFDLEEDYTASVKENNKDKVFYSKGNFCKGLLLRSPFSTIVDSNAKEYKASEPFYGYSSPIYYQNRILRI